MCRNAVYLFCGALILVAVGAKDVRPYRVRCSVTTSIRPTITSPPEWQGRAGTGSLAWAPARRPMRSTPRSPAPGQLYLESAGASLDAPWDAMPPFLFKLVEGDFIATVKVTDYAGTEAAPVYHNNCG